MLFISSADMSSDNSDLHRKIAIAAAATVGVVGVGLGLYYLSTSSSNKKNDGKPQMKLEDMTVTQLKELGNKLFAAKKYANAVEVFSKAIEREQTGVDDVKALCFQNRAAAKEYLGNIPVEEIIEDCTEAINRRPLYGKAYIRRAKSLQKQEKYLEALTDLMSATHVDESLDQQIGQSVATLVDLIAKEEKEEWLKENGGEDKVTPVRHERVYAWLHKFTFTEPLREQVVEFDSEPKTPFEHAILLVRERNYDSVAQSAEQEQGPNRLLALLLAARFYVYKNERTKAAELLKKFDQEYDALIDLEKEDKKEWLQSRHILYIEMGTNKDDILKRLEDALVVDGKLADLYTTAAFRLTMIDELDLAKDVLNREEVPEGINSSLMKLMLNILVAVRNSDMGQVHNMIFALESYVNGMEAKTPYAISLLAKIYTLFQNSDGARELLKELLEVEGGESCHWFDSGMLAQSEAELMTGLEKCIKLEPHHAEGNLMLASLKVNHIGTRGLTAEEFDECWSCLERACEVIAGTTDFPAVEGVFRMRAILKAKRAAGERFEQA